MDRSFVRAIAVFLVGLGGWLVAAALRIENEALYAWPVAMGLVAGVVAGRAIALPLLWLGWLAAIPAGLALGLLAYVDFNAESAFGLVLAFATLAVGFVGGLLVARYLGRARLVAAGQRPT